MESPFALARTRLCCAEQLRRAGRRIDARDQLRASGETLRRRELHEAGQLTPQELQIALQVAEGKASREVAAALVLSHKTVEFHLSRIYRKLDLTSRAELILLLATEPALPMA